MGVTAHWLHDNFATHNKCLTVHPVLGSHIANFICRSLATITRQSIGLMNAQLSWRQVQSGQEMIFNISPFSGQLLALRTSEESIQYIDQRWNVTLITPRPVALNMDMMSYAFNIAIFDMVRCIMSLLYR